MKNRKNICLNCEYSLNGDEKYCPNCGQNAEFQDLSLKHLFMSFLDNFLNFDAKLFKTFRDIWIPNKLTRSFIAGKRNIYVHPFRFMFICLVIYFGLISISMKDLELFKEAEPSAKLARHELHDKFLMYRDSLEDETNYAVFDSLDKNIFKDEWGLLRDTFFNGQIMGVDFSKLGIPPEDAYGMNRDSLFKKYQISGRMDRFVVSQVIRVMEKPDQSIRFLIANMLWGIILLTFLLAAVLYLLYVRHNTYYVESVLHMTHYHVTFLVIMSFAMLLELFWETKGYLFIASFIIPVIYLFCNLKMYYNQGIIKTFIKVSIFHAVYFMCLMMVMAMTAIISLFFF